MATRRFMGSLRLQAARARLKRSSLATLRHNSSPPRHFYAPEVTPAVWRNAPVAVLRETSMTSLSPHLPRPATRHEMLANWLALLTLLALGIVWPQHADSPQARVHAGLTDKAAREHARRGLLRPS